MRALSAGLLVIGGISCGGDGPTGNGEAAEIGSVVITGATATPMLVGTTLQLVATTINESGGMVSNQRIAWTTSDADVATVGAGGLITARGAGRATITASAGGRTATTVADVRDGGPVTSEGRVLTMLGGRAVLAIPAGAVRQTTTFMVAPPIGPLAAAPGLLPGSAIEIVPEALPFMPAARLTLGYDPAALPAGVPEASLELHMRLDGQWVRLPGGTLDVATHRVTGFIGGTGIYAVMSTPVDHVILGGPALAGALTVGQSTQLSAAVYDAVNAPLTGRSVQWTTSNAALATVDTTGRVTATGAGSVTITATSEGRSANTTLLVLARATSDWSQVTTDWTTYQGNARHSGYVPAIIDAGLLRELWVATPLGAVSLNPVTAGDGHVFVTGGAQIGAVDARTGALQWSRSLGAVDGVHPPAFGSGAVYVTTSGHQNSFLWSLEAGSGTVRFRSAYGNQWSHYYAPVILGGAVHMAGGYYGGSYSFDATSGAQRWFAGGNQYDEWSPAVQDGLSYSYTGSYSPKVSAVDAATGVERFAIADPRFQWSGWSMDLAPALGESNDLLVTNGGRLISFNLSARTIGWEQTAQFTGSVAVAAGKVYAVNSGQVDIRRASDGSLIGPWIAPEGRVQGPVIVTRNLLFASTATTTYAVDIATRRQIWSYPAGGALALSSQGVLLIAQSGGRLVGIAVK